MPARIITPPAVEPVTLDEAKAQLRLETALDDTEVSRLIVAARQYVEQYCWRGLMQQTWELVLEGFHGKDARELPGWTRRHFSYNDPIRLPMGQLAELDDDAPAVTWVKYIDPDGVERTLATTEYTVDAVSVPGYIRPAHGKSWPATREQWDALRIRYVVGWAEDEQPEQLKQAVLLAISEMYENRTPDLELPGVNLLANPFRLTEIG